MGGPYVHTNGSKEREEKNAASTVCQSNGLKDKTSQSEEKEHVACPSIEIAEGETGFEGDGDEDRVDCSRGNTSCENESDD